MFGAMASSTAAILIRFAQQDAPSLVIAAWRMGLATFILATSGTACATASNSDH